jgi:phage-related protein
VFVWQSACRVVTSLVSGFTACHIWHGFEPLVMKGDRKPKPVRWIGSSREDVSDFPDPVRLRVGGALWEAQLGGKAAWTKPLQGFGGAGVLEVMDDYDGDTYRAVYTVRFSGVVYVLHAFQKKSKSGIATPRHEIALIEQRLRRASEDYERWQTTTKTTSR